MTQEITLYLPINEEGSRSKAMTVASKLRGVIRVEIVRERNHLVVIGEGVDSVNLAKSLRKKFCFAIIVRVRNVNPALLEEDKDDVQHQTFYNYNNNNPPHQYNYHHHPQPTNYIAYPVHDPSPPPCSIL